MITRDLKKKRKYRRTKYLCDYLREEIAEKTGFSERKIILQISQRSNPNIPKLDHHEFKYEGKNYLLVGNDLKCLDK